MALLVVGAQVSNLSEPIGGKVTWIQLIEFRQGSQWGRELT